MRCPLRSIAKRPRLKIRLEDGLQNELHRSLDHAVADGRYRENAHRAVVLRDCLPPRPHRPIAACDQFVLQLREEVLHTRRLDGFKGHPIFARGAVVGFGHRIRRAQCLPFAEVHVQAPEAPRRVCLRLGVYPSLQVLQCDRRLYHSAPASLWSKECVRQQGSFAPRPLRRFLTTMCPSDSRSSAPDFPVDTGYTGALLRRLSRRDETGLSNGSTRPCPRAVATTPPEWAAASVSVRQTMRPSPSDGGLGLWS